MRTPPSFTPFPYTTLFRSEQGFDGRDNDTRRTGFLQCHVGAVGGWVRIARQHDHPQAGRLCCAAYLVAADVGQAEIDRKSTRLNSSHLGISYAVFCLKKKN